jgi:hypothetical protein
VVENSAIAMIDQQDVHALLLPPRQAGKRGSATRELRFVRRRPAAKRRGLEDAVLEQLANIYRDTPLIERALSDAAKGTERIRPRIERDLAGCQAETARIERKLDRYFAAIGRPHLTRTDRIGMTEPKSAFRANDARHRSSAVRSHGARTVAA